MRTRTNHLTSSYWALVGYGVDECSGALAEQVGADEEAQGLWVFGDAQWWQVSTDGHQSRPLRRPPWPACSSPTQASTSPCASSAAADDWRWPAEDNTTDPKPVMPAHINELIGLRRSVRTQP
jgi:hypothetical protein